MQATALTPWHIEQGARMVDFFGWNMPLFYSGITEEHHHTRTKAGLFDLGHMGRVMVSGQDRLAFIDQVTPADVAAAEPGLVQYSFLLDEAGHTIDDVTIYYAEDWVMLVVNSSNTVAGVRWLESYAAASGMRVTVEDYSARWGMVALQGPQAVAALRRCFGAGVPVPDYYHFDVLTDTVAPGQIVYSRTGYTGEDGFEFYLAQEQVPALWRLLVDGSAPEAQVAPIGLGARDSLRLEAAMPLYGHELLPTSTPAAAGLGKFVALGKAADFCGKRALLTEREEGGPARKLVAFEVAARGPVPRQGFVVRREADCASEAVGEVASGVFSPTLERLIGTAWVPAELAGVGRPVYIEVRGKIVAATQVKKPFYKRSR